MTAISVGYHQVFGLYWPILVDFYHCLIGLHDVDTGPRKSYRSFFAAAENLCFYLVIYLKKVWWLWTTHDALNDSELYVCFLWCLMIEGRADTLFKISHIIFLLAGRSSLSRPPECWIYLPRFCYLKPWSHLYSAALLFPTNKTQVQTIKLDLYGLISWFSG